MSKKNCCRGGKAETASLARRKNSFVCAMTVRDNKVILHNFCSKIVVKTYGLLLLISLFWVVITVQRSKEKIERKECFA